jgi:hypothetical protein
VAIEFAGEEAFRFAAVGVPERGVDEWEVGVEVPVVLLLLLLLNPGPDFETGRCVLVDCFFVVVVTFTRVILSGSGFMGGAPGFASD